MHQECRADKTTTNHRKYYKWPAAQLLSMKQRSAYWGAVAVLQHLVSNLHCWFLHPTVLLYLFPTGVRKENCSPHPTVHDRAFNQPITLEQRGKITLEPHFAKTIGFDILDSRGDMAPLFSLRRRGATRVSHIHTAPLIDNYKLTEDGSWADISEKLRFLDVAIGGSWLLPSCARSS